MTTRWVQGVSRDLVRTAFRDWFGVQDNQADVLVSLYEAQGQSIQSRALCAAINSHRPLSMGALHERIRALRTSMESESVDFAEGAGYSLTEIGIAECNVALRKMAETLVAGGFMLPRIPAAPKPARVAKRCADRETLDLFGEDTLIRKASA